MQEELGKEAKREGRKEARKEERREGRRKGSKEGRKEEGKEGRREGRKEGRKAGRKEGRKEGRKQGRTEGRKEGRKERRGMKKDNERKNGRNEERQTARKQKRKEGSKEGRKQGAPEAKPILDPLYPGRETVDVAKYLDFGHWLEAANGGKFDWGTGAEEKSLKRPDTRRRAEEETTVPLSFNPTNVNLCLFQQYRLFRKWWVTVEQNHSCGFSARILMNATARAIVDKDTGLLDSSPITKALQSIWLRTAAAWGPRASQPNQFLRPWTEAQKSIRRFYYALHEQEERGGWGSATKASLGEMEYHVPTAACLTALVQFSAMQEEPTYVLSDSAVKCGIQHFDMRVVHSCAVLDSEIFAKTLQAPASSRRPGSPPTQRAERTLPQRLLAACTKNPITMTEVGVHISSLKGAAK